MLATVFHTGDADDCTINLFTFLIGVLCLTQEYLANTMPASIIVGGNLAMKKTVAKGLYITVHHV